MLSRMLSLGNKRQTTTLVTSTLEDAAEDLKNLTLSQNTQPSVRYKRSFFSDRWIVKFDEASENYYYEDTV